MRLKIIIGNALLVLAVGLIGYFFVKTQVVASAEDALSEQIGHDVEILQRSFRLSASEFLDHVGNKASAPELASLFNAGDQTSLRRRASIAATSVSSWFEDPSRGMSGAPFIVLFTDETGTIIARDQDPNALHGVSLHSDLPALGAVLEQGVARHDLWYFEAQEKVLRVAAAPVRSPDGTVVGALVVGYDLSGGFATDQAEVIAPSTVAYLVDGRVYAASGNGPVVDEHVAADGPFKSAAGAALQRGTTSGRIELTSGGQDYLAMVAPLPGVSSMPAAFATLTSRAPAREAGEVANVLLILALFGLLGACAYGFIIGGSLVQPLEEIEEGVLKVINGDTSHRIDVGDGEFGGLAYRINQLINVFTGVDDTDEEGHTTSSGAWQIPTEGSPQAVSAGSGAAPAASAEGVPADGGDANLAAQLAAEPADAYYDRVYQEYVGAKKAAGEDVSNITPERFVKRLQGQEAAMAQKKGVRMVRFRVNVDGAQVSLKPVLIN